MSNDEHKGLGSSDLITDISTKKNMQLNKSTVVNGRVLMVTYKLYQDVAGERTLLYFLLEVTVLTICFTNCVLHDFPF